MFRQGLAMLCRTEGDIECIAQASDGYEAVRQVRELMPDVVVLEISLPKLSGIEAINQIKSTCPNTAVLVLSSLDHDTHILRALQAGAAGYVLKNAQLTELIGAIRLVAKGDTVLILNSSRRIIDLLGKVNKHHPGGDVLQPRELEVLKLAARGMSNREIAGQLIISERTVHTHLHNVFKKLGASSRTQAVLTALRHGWLDVDEPLDEKKSGAVAPLQPRDNLGMPAPQRPPVSGSVPSVVTLR